MRNNEWEIPKSVKDEGEKYFSKPNLESAYKLLKLSRVSISFTKGSPETYFIVSGIIRDDRAHESKVVFKKRLVGTEEGPVSSNCDCHKWTKEDHCVHTTALFLTYHLNLYSESHEHEDGIDGHPPIPVNSSFGVNAAEYGTILAGPHQLQGAPPAPTYSALQYLLHNKKVVNFPIPENFRGKLVISITSHERFNEVTQEIETYPVIFYKYKNEDNEVIREISVFENLYLFNWLTGEAYHLSSQLKSLIQKIRIRGFRLGTNDLIRAALDEDLKNQCEVIIDGIPLEEIKEVKPNCRFTIVPGDKKSQLEVNIIFYDDDEKIVTPPDFITALTFTGGHLSSFKKKRDVYDFIGHLSDLYKDDVELYKRTLVNSSKRDHFLSLIDYNKKNEETLIYDSVEKEICHYHNDFLFAMISEIHENFGDMAFRFAEYRADKKEISLQITATNVFQGLTDFHKKMQPFGTSIYYDKAEINVWSSRIRFERKQSHTKWFDLELNISKEDLEIIKMAEMENGLALTKNGLVLLDKDQKDLLRFMKKYTKYEGNESENDEDEFKKFLLPFNRARIFELFELKRLGVDGALTEEENKLCEKLMTLEEVPEYPMPEHLDEIVRPYQRTGYNWLKFLHESKLGACLADDMGLGKTLQTIAFIDSIYDQVDKVLVVCPVSILLNWEKEIKKFSKIEPYIYHGGERKFPENTKVILTSYGVMKREIEHTFKGKQFDVLVLDEVQHLKNIRSLGAFAARQIEADFRVCLTGTPVENDLAEFYNILDLSIPGIWGDLQFIRTSSNQKSRLLARKTATPFILRRTKSQVLTDLPPKIENNVFLNLSTNEKETYDNSLVDIRNSILTAPSRKKYGEILRGLLKLRQQCLWQDVKPGQQVSLGSLNSTKVEFLVETLEQILEEGHQAIVFSQFTTYLDIIQNVLREKHMKLSRIDGSQSIKKRQKQVDEFQSGETQVFLISLKAGGVGLNLTAASYVFMMDPWWNPAVESQAIDRAHRIGQKNTLTVYRPIIKDSVEEKVMELQEVKRKLFKDLLEDDDDAAFTGKLSMKDFENLFT
jgi:SNF2 family DNA or RNA helicase